MEGIERKSYSAAVIEGVRKRARVFVGDSIVRKTDRVLNKGDDVVVCLPGAKIEAITERVKNIVGSAPKRRRIRRMSNETDSEPEPGPAMKKKHVRQISSDDSCSGQQTEEEKINFLAGAFPNIDTEILLEKLESEDGSIEAATMAISNAVANGKITPSKNRGSIKAFKAARAVSGKKFNNNAEPQPADARKASRAIFKGGNKQKVRKEDVDSDSDDDVVDGEYEEDDIDDDEEGSGEETESFQKVQSEPVMTFLNEATLEELLSIPGCSKKKATQLSELRPFKDWAHLSESIIQCKLSLSLISGCRELLRTRKSVQRLMEKCEKISSEMACVINELTSEPQVDDGDNDNSYIMKQPALLNASMTLTQYQMVGLNWLALMHTQELNGILGDEMGLGKTIQTISFLAHLLEEGSTGPHLIVTPSSTLDNWLRELKIWCPALGVLLYYGSMEERKEIRSQLLHNSSFDDYNVILTSYHIAASSSDDRILFKKLLFHYAIFDEGHMLKNMSSLRYQSLMKIRAERRLLLTGTPLQNNLLELMSLLSFVMPHMFGGKTEQLKRIFMSISSHNGGDSRSAYEQSIIIRAKSILKPFFLRRLKSEVLQQLPLKEEVVERVPMAFEQQDLYDELKLTFVKTITEDGKHLNVLKGGQGSTMMMMLRKAANHHLLHRRQYDLARLRQMAQIMVQEPSLKDPNENYIFEDMEVMSDFELHQLCRKYNSLSRFKLDEELITDSGKFRFLDGLLPKMKEKGDRVLLFSQFTMMLDIIEAYMKSRKYEYVRLDGATAVVERQELIDRFNTNDKIFVFLLSTRAGGLGINLTTANVVILHDIDYNPYNDKQAMDRCHRVGQTRTVKVYRLVSANSIEEAMLRCAQAKLKLEQDVTGTNTDGEEAYTTDVASWEKSITDAVSNPAVDTTLRPSGMFVS
ncbi:SWI/SNF-related matrix-associated actin-dependent regulator of chromatin subfamily A containing DEAD/H box 1 [Lamellibrachia satsuma]|nr:SWI/SNF-related matrix-associated actin-dependent regulator of chromatin subfamily A containing DEAD/H box 1 [Lamellibrachia satsuma]